MCSALFNQKMKESFSLSIYIQRCVCLVVVFEIVWCVVFYFVLLRVILS